MGGRGSNAGGGGRKVSGRVIGDDELNDISETSFDEFFDNRVKIPKDVAHFSTDETYARMKVIQQQGFDGQPTVVSEDTFVKQVAASGSEVMWRGVANAEQADQFRYGNLYYGTGMYGNGTYATTNREAARTYGDLAKAQQGNVLKMALKPDAKVIAYNDAYSMTKSNKGAHILMQDVGVYAAAKGYDAILAPQGSGENYYVVLNRTAVIVSDTKYS